MEKTPIPRKKTPIPGIEVVRETARSVRQVCFLNERPPSLLANQYLISQPLLSQPQLAPHKHATEVASPQYTLHWHLQHLNPQNQIAAVSVPRSGGRNRSACFRTLRRGTESVRWRQRKGSARLHLRWQIPLRTPGLQPSLCLGNSGTRALPKRPRERTQGGIGAFAGEAHRSAQSQCSRALTVHSLLPNRQHKECVYPHPLDNADRDEHTS